MCKPSAKIFLLLVPIFLLSACLSPEELARVHQRMAEESAQSQRIYIAELRDKCLRYGFKRDTAELAHCIQKEEQQDKLNAELANQQAQIRRLRAEQQRARELCFQTSNNC